MMTLVTDDPFAVAAASADRLTALAGPHDAAVVLGSGWSPAADAIGATETEIPLAELGGFPVSTVPGHTPVVRIVAAGAVRVLVFLGRVHLYEGLSPAAVVHGPDRPVLAATARAGPRDRSEPGRGRLRDDAGPALRDPGGDHHARPAGRRPGRDVDRPGGDRGPAPGRGGARRLPGHQPGGGPGR